MGIQYRNGRAYYYRCYRKDGRIRNEYVTCGDAAILAAECDAQAREQLAALRRRIDAKHNTFVAAREPLLDLTAQSDQLISAALLDAGYHNPDRGPWRKKRHDKKNER